MPPQMFAKRTLLSGRSYGCSFAIMIEVVQNFFDQFADSLPGFHFAARLE